MRIVLILICMAFFSSCASLNTDVIHNIKRHAFTYRKAVILGDGVASEVAEKSGKSPDVLVLYRVERVSVASSHRFKQTPFMKDVAASLRAMASSGDFWEIVVAERARPLFTAVLGGMRDQELSALTGRFVFAARAEKDQLLQSQITRVFSSKMKMEYVR
ncbi:MAG: hypothetical protein HQL16_05190 [Candidatus Omnitrophica bacterium]|nr:hypothetical protein [Candidatus Omnitrophota bacterium]